jgi:protein-tyrosine-phosphatase
MTMKVLFVCYANVGRSQVAEVCFKTLSQHECDSAGIAVNERIAAMKLASKRFKDYPNQSSVEYIRREFGVDIGEKERQQLVPEMVDTADLVIVIAEKERWPAYLKEGGKVLFWNIQDPAGMADEIADDIYGQVQSRVQQLVAEIG